MAEITSESPTEPVETMTPEQRAVNNFQRVLEGIQHDLPSILSNMSEDDKGRLREKLAEINKIVPDPGK